MKTTVFVPRMGVNLVHVARGHESVVLDFPDKEAIFTWIHPHWGNKLLGYILKYEVVWSNDQPSCYDDCQKYTFWAKLLNGNDYVINVPNMRSSLQKGHDDWWEKIVVTRHSENIGEFNLKNLIEKISTQVILESENHNSYVPKKLPSAYPNGRPKVHASVILGDSFQAFDLPWLRYENQAYMRIFELIEDGIACQLEHPVVGFMN